MSTVLSILFFISAIGIRAQQTQPGSGTNEPNFPDASAYANSNLSYKIIDAPNKTYGYDIYADGRKKIHQTSIPCLPGHEGFKTQASAEKVALLVISKLKKGESLPSVTIEEMQSLKAIP